MGKEQASTEQKLSKAAALLLLRTAQPLTPEIREKCAMALAGKRLVA